MYLISGIELEYSIGHTQIDMRFGILLLFAINEVLSYLW